MRNQLQPTAGLKRKRVLDLGTVGKLFISGIILSGFFLFAHSLSSIDLSHHGTYQGLSFRGSFSQYLAYLQKNGSLGLVKFYSQHCYPCQKLDAVLESDPNFMTHLSMHYTFMKIDGPVDLTHDTKLRNCFSVDTFPTILFIDPQGNELFRFEGQKELKHIRSSIRKFEMSGKVPQRVKVKKKKPTYSFVLGRNLGYKEAQAQARELSFLWNNEVFIQPDPISRKLLVLGGKFVGKDMAKHAQKDWEAKHGSTIEIISLEEIGLHFQEDNSSSCQEIIP